MLTVVRNHLEDIQKSGDEESDKRAETALENARNVAVELQVGPARG